jgi:ferredoxin
LARDIFRVNEDGTLAISAEIDDAQRQTVQDAADSYPTRAITVAD